VSKRALLLAVFHLLAVLACASRAEPALPAAGRFATFESAPVRPIELSPDGKRLYVLNTPDNRLEIYRIKDGVPEFRRSVRVGLEPVALASRGDREVWVVNHLSDSVSIVDVGARPPRVRRTLLVGDEPRDIVFAGPGRSRAFVTAAHRGQNVPFDPQPFTPGVGRADIWVFDAANTGSGPGGTPLAILSLFGDTLRPLAASPDGSRVYAGVFNSGNRTTTLQADIASGGLAKPGPDTDVLGNRAPQTGLIVRYDGAHWVDDGNPATGEAPRSWDARVRFELPDYDIFEIDADATPPAETRRVSGVGTTLFGLAVNPRSGALYVSNTEARNDVRFEGPGTRSSTVRGHFVESRVTVVPRDGSALPRHLNRHITSYDSALGTPEERALSLATPTALAVSRDGQRLYVAGFGSGKVAWLDTAALEKGDFVLSPERETRLGAGGPGGLALDERRGRLYVLTRFDNGLSTIDLASGRELRHQRMYNPEPPEVVEGRRFLYDAAYTSSRGDSSCAGCHVFADMDHLAWDLGNPDDRLVESPNTYNRVVPSFLARRSFHPLKGPMSTQSLRGMAGNGPMHWRGDRTGATRKPGESLELQAFKDFSVAFTGLLGRSEPLSDAEMTAFARFALELSYPPNPYRALDNNLSADEQAGSDFYHDVVSDTIATCNGCHVLDPGAGFFGTNGTMSIEGAPIDEDFKIPHLRNVYQKVGMFGSTGNPAQGAPYLGPQIRGFGVSNDGAVDTVISFLHASVFRFPGEAVREQTARFVLAFPSDLAPIVGQQLTVSADNHRLPEVRARAELLRDRALVRTPRPECELVVSGVIDERRFSGLMNAEGSFTTTDGGRSPIDFDELYAAAGRGDAAVTFTCVPPGNGLRIGLDRDLDGVRDCS